MSHQPGNQGPYGGNRNLAFRPDRKGGPGGGNNPGGRGGGGGGGGGRTCNTCGKLGHIARDCPQGNYGGGPSAGGQKGRPEGSYGGGAQGNRGSTAASPSISTKMDAEIKEENTLVISFGDKNRTGVPNPYRPSYGTNGKPVEFWTNYFPVILPCELTLYRYNITIDDRYDEEEKKLPEPKSNKLKQIVRILLISLETLKPKVHIATDFKSTLVCSGEIPQKSWHPNIVYVHEDDKTPGNHPQRYQLHIEEKQPPLKVSELKKFLGSAEMVAQYEHRDSMLQALNILLGHHAKSTPTTTMVGGNRAYTRDQATERSSLQGGVEAVRGYFLSVRLASFRTLVNVNVSHGAFYEATGLPDLITKWVNHNKLDMKSESEWTRLETLLKGVKMRTNYLKDNSGKHITQVRSVKGFASQRDGGGQSLHPHVEVFAAPPYQVWFHLNDVRDFSRQKWKLKDENRAIRDKYISVDEFFESKHTVISNPKGMFPVINFGSKGDPNYVPAEACTVVPGQLAKLSPGQSDGMIAFAVRPPDLNIGSIKNRGLPALGLSPTGLKMVAFDAKIDDNMIKVCGRMLSLPSVLYKDGKEPPLAMGGWNLRGVNFAIPVPNAKHGKLGKWGCLRLLDPDPRSQREGNDRFESSVLEFKKMLQTCGIKTDEPWKETSGLGKKLEETIRAAHRDWKMEILLVVLPNKNTELYNMIKGFCDRVEGIHTVCVIAAGFYKRNGTYFANVALKFNLKLGGTNHTLKDADTGIVSKGKTMVVGIDVVHPSPGSGKASVASMVANINKDLAQWPVDLRVQLRKGQEMLDKIYEMLSSRLSLWKKHNKSYPENVLVYRDGVSESQYQQVLDEELKCMRDASQNLYREASQRSPRFTLVIVGKRHHTRFFPIEQNFASDSNGNPNRGLVVDRGVTEARNWDFFLQSHNAIKGTARPAHYFVLWDEIFTNIALEADHQTLQPGSLPADRLERLTHSLCYVFSRAAKAVSIPAPVYYADIACERANRYLADSSTGSESATTDNTRMNAGQRERLCSELQEQIKIHENLRNDMFYI